MALFEAQHLRTDYRRNGKVFTPFRDVSFTLDEGRIYDLVGPSGSGKTTLLRVCARLLNRTNGDMLLNGKTSGDFAPTEWRRQVCLVPQQSSLIPGTVKDNLLFPWTLKINQDKEKPSEDTLRHLLDLADLPDVELERDASQLSGGQQARVALLRVFATKPTVLLLDEVDAALDNDSAEAVGKLTKTLVDATMSCLRIRHRAADGFAYGTYTLADGVMSYQQNPLTEENAPVLGSASS